MFHKHHLIPKYQGGTDDEFNLVDVTIVQHAMFHYCNWVLWRNKYDWIAWKGLAGMIDKEEVVKQVISHSSKRRGLTRKGKEHARFIQPLAVKAALTEKIKQKRKESFRVIGHQQGKTNSQYGTIWITNGEVNRKIKKDAPLPEGYSPGRIMK